MLFNSLHFALFLPVVLGVYYLLPHKQQNVFLLVASAFFYACWDWRFLLPLLFSASMDYLCASRMSELDNDADGLRSRKRYLSLSLVTNLGLLGFFKYFNFFTGSVQTLLDQAGLHASPIALKVILPVGISFYTFQALSYTIDVYRGQLHPTSRFTDFLLAVLYFPHLVAGPIQRAHSLLPQVLEPRTITREKIRAGMHLIMAGFLKKVFIADNLAPVANQVFSMSHPDGYHVLLGIYAFAIQIYCDFSGYTDIARGVAKLMGFEFMLNFNHPYFATNPSDFWSRWHISLSSWLRDYLYIPLGGNRGKAWKVKRNLILTMVIGGLWHGAAWNFVLWGLYHGLLLVAHKQAEPIAGVMFRASTPTGRRISRAVRVALMFQFTCYGWLLFRADSLHQIAVMTRALVHPLTGSDTELTLRLAGFALPLVAVQVWKRVRSRMRIPGPRWMMPEIRVVAYALAVYLILFVGGEPKSFLYFQF